MSHDKTYRLKGKHKPSSQRWLMRHLNDPWVHKATAMGYRCRSAFKLLELQERFGLLRPGMAVLDLGCAPGGWCQVASALVGARPSGPRSQSLPDVSSTVSISCEKDLSDGPLSNAGCLMADGLEQAGHPCALQEDRSVNSDSADTHGRDVPAVKGHFMGPGHASQGFVLGIDRLLMEPLSGVQFVQGDILEPDTEAAWASHTFDVILSDMAPSLTGHTDTDRVQMEALMEMVWDVTQDKLRPGGTMAMKAFHTPLIRTFTPFFQSVSYVKPKSSRATSREIYVVARGWKGR